MGREFNLCFYRYGLEVLDALGVVGAKVVCDLVVVYESPAQMVHSAVHARLRLRTKAGENHDIQMHLFGKMPNRDTNLCTGACSVVRLKVRMKLRTELEPEPLTQPVASSTWRRLARIDLPAPVQKGWKTVSPDSSIEKRSKRTHQGRRT